MTDCVIVGKGSFAFEADEFLPPEEEDRRDEFLYKTSGGLLPITGGKNLRCLLMMRLVIAIRENLYPSGIREIVRQVVRNPPTPSSSVERIAIRCVEGEDLSGNVEAIRATVKSFLQAIANNVAETPEEWQRFSEAIIRTERTE
ncbi:MAG: hypothetical protein Q7S16_03555 [bacterium]|nr:hypothetical protein [bacterium]